MVVNLCPLNLFRITIEYVSVLSDVKHVKLELKSVYHVNWHISFIFLTMKGLFSHAVIHRGFIQAGDYHDCDCFPVNQAIS